MGGRGSGGGRSGGKSSAGGTKTTLKDNKENKKVETKKKELSPEEQKKLKAEELKKKRLAALEKARAKRAENLKNGIKPDPNKKPKKKKAKMTMDNTVYDLKSDLMNKVKTDGYIRRSDFSVEDYGDTISVSIRHLGKWSNPSDAWNEEDYDWQELSRSSRSQIDKVVTKLQRRSGREITWSTGEKNWISFDIEKKKGE